MNETATPEVWEYKIKLVGVLGSAAGKREMTVQGPPSLVLSELISKLLAQVDKRQFRELLIDSSTSDPLPNVIILLNEHDCNLFQGLKTTIEPESLVTIIPVAHGG